MKVQKWRFMYTDSQSYLYRCFESHSNHALSLQMMYILIYLNLFLDMVLQFSLLHLISYWDTKKYSNIVENINWVLSELSA